MTQCWLGLSPSSFEWQNSILSTLLGNLEPCWEVASLQQHRWNWFLSLFLNFGSRTRIWQNWEITALQMNSMDCSGPAIAYCATLIKSLPASFCLRFIHWDSTFFKIWLISYYFCSVSGNNAAPLLACASALPWYNNNSFKKETNFLSFG